MIQKVPMLALPRPCECIADVVLERVIDSKAITGLFLVENHHRLMLAVIHLWPSRFRSLVVASNGFAWSSVVHVTRIVYRGVGREDKYKEKGALRKAMHRI
jgi:hypothetical protein